MTIYDAFPFHDELDILEMRLTELQGVPRLKHILVESPVSHTGKPKELWFAENRARFAPWADRIIHVVATRMPTLAEDPHPWARELAQRDHITDGLKFASKTDILMQSDVDEIPSALVVRNLNPKSVLAFEQRGHFWAVDWLHPDPWMGTVAVPLSTNIDMRTMRGLRNTAKRLPNAGWHFSWLGGTERARKKIDNFCHPEVTPTLDRGLEEDRFYREGYHCDMQKMAPVDVDETWPRWIREGHAPASWFRPR